MTGLGVVRDAADVHDGLGCDKGHSLCEVVDWRLVWQSMHDRLGCDEEHSLSNVVGVLATCEPVDVQWAWPLGTMRDAACVSLEALRWWTGDL